MVMKQFPLRVKPTNKPKHLLKGVQKWILRILELKLSQWKLNKEKLIDNNSSNSNLNQLKRQKRLPSKQKRLNQQQSSQFQRHNKTKRQTQYV